MSNDNQQNKKVFNEDSAQYNNTVKKDFRRHETFSAQPQNKSKRAEPICYPETPKKSGIILNTDNVKKTSSNDKE